jgi:hypothetical protein
MYFITDANGEQLRVEDVNATLAQVEVFLTDVEILPAMTAEEIIYYKDLKEKLLQLQLTAGK